MNKKTITFKNGRKMSVLPEIAENIAQYFLTKEELTLKKE
jgi:hypothetical protein